MCEKEIFEREKYIFSYISLRSDFLSVDQDKLLR